MGEHDNDYNQLSTIISSILTSALLLKDTRDVLEDICKEETQSVQEKMLKENVEGHVCFTSTELIDKFWGDFPGHLIMGTYV